MVAAGAVSAGRVLRGVSGVLAGCLVVLLLVLIAAWSVSGRTDMPGPGVGMLGWHAAAVLVAVPAQVYADRRPDRLGAAAAGLVLVTAGLLLVLGWLV